MGMWTQTDRKIHPDTRKRYPSDLRACCRIRAGTILDQDIAAFPWSSVLYIDARRQDFGLRNSLQTEQIDAGVGKLTARAGDARGRGFRHGPCSAASDTTGNQSPKGNPSCRLSRTAERMFDAGSPPEGGAGADQGEAVVGFARRDGATRL